MPLPESSHPYLPNTYDTQSYTIAGAGGLLLTFDPLTETEPHTDWLYVQTGSGANISGSPFSGRPFQPDNQRWVAGDTVNIILTSDFADEYWGYKVTAAVATGAVAIKATTPPKTATTMTYSATLLTWSSVTVSWSVTGGSLPPGLTLDASTGVISGTPTAAGTYTFTVTASDGSGHSDHHDYTILVEDYFATGPVLALHIFSGERIWYSYRSASGYWYLSKLYTDASDVAGYVQAGTHGVSAGVEIVSNASNPRGVIGDGADGPWYLGQGKPAPAYSIHAGIDNLPSSVEQLHRLDYFDCAHGAWTIGGETWLALRYNIFNPMLYPPDVNYYGPTQVAMLRANAFDDAGIPTGWHIEDISNQPGLAKDLHRNLICVRWDGVSSTVDFFTSVGGDQSTYSTFYGFRTFDTVSKTWSSPYGVLDFGRQVIPAYSFHTDWGGNCLYRYPNGDIGLVYSDATAGFGAFGSKIFYRLYSGGSWGAEVVIKDHSSVTTRAMVGQVIPDLGGEKLHVFSIYSLASTGNPTGTYHIVEHSGTVHADLFQFPERPGGTDGFGRGVNFGGTLIVPYDDFWGVGNTVWAGVITGGATTFYEELLPTPDIEAGNVPSCAYLLFSQAPEVMPIPPSTSSIFPQYIKRRNLVAH